MVIINGAGIAGLTLANALQQLNIPYLVIEQGQDHSVLGAGIALQNNGLAIMQKLGLLPLLPVSAVTHMAIGHLGFVRRVNLAEVGLKCRVVHRQQLHSALLANLPPGVVRMNTTIDRCTVLPKKISVRFNDHTNEECRFLVNAAGIRSTLHAPVELRETPLWCWRTVLKLNKPISCFGEYWFGRQRLGIAPIDEQHAYVFHVIKLQPSQTPDSYSSKTREQWIQNKINCVPDVDALEFTGKPWLSHPLQDRGIHWGDGRLVAIGDAAHAMTPNLGQGAVLGMEDAIELANLIRAGHSSPAQALARIRHKRVARTHRLSYWVGRLAHVDNRYAARINSAIVKRMPLSLGMKSQVTWMNQFNHRH